MPDVYLQKGQRLHQAVLVGPMRLVINHNVVISESQLEGITIEATDPDVPSLIERCVITNCQFVVRS